MVSPAIQKSHRFHAVPGASELAATLASRQRFPHQGHIGRVVIHHEDVGRYRLHACPPARSSGPWAGRVNLKVEPEPDCDSTQILPPSRSTIFLQMARPMPLPAYSERACKRWKTIKMFCAYSGAIPIPLSLTRNSQRWSAFSACMEITGGAVPRNLMAFPIRFWNICATCV